VTQVVYSKIWYNPESCWGIYSASHCKETQYACQGWTTGRETLAEWRQRLRTCFSLCIHTHTHTHTHTTHTHAENCSGRVSHSNKERQRNKGRTGQDKPTDWQRLRICINLCTHTHTNSHTHTLLSHTHWHTREYIYILSYICMYIYRGSLKLTEQNQSRLDVYVERTYEELALPPAPKGAPWLSDIKTSANISISGANNTRGRDISSQKDSTKSLLHTWSHFWNVEFYRTCQSEGSIEHAEAACLVNFVPSPTSLYLTEQRTVNWHFHYSTDAF
jgi:hypothetical protein